MFNIYHNIVITINNIQILITICFYNELIVQIAGRWLMNLMLGNKIKRWLNGYVILFFYLDMYVFLNIITICTNFLFHLLYQLWLGTSLFVYSIFWWYYHNHCNGFCFLLIICWSFIYLKKILIIQSIWLLLQNVLIIILLK